MRRHLFSRVRHEGALASLETAIVLPTSWFAAGGPLHTKRHSDGRQLWAGSGAIQTLDEQNLKCWLMHAGNNMLSLLSAQFQLAAAAAASSRLLTCHAALISAPIADCDGPQLFGQELLCQAGERQAAGELAAANVASGSHVLAPCSAERSIKMACRQNALHSWAQPGQPARRRAQAVAVRPSALPPARWR